MKTALALLLPAVSMAFRDDVSRQLVEIDFDGRSWRDLMSLGVFERDDFEEMYSNKAKLWATESHLTELANNDWRVMPTVDESANNFLVESTNKYMDSTSEPPRWDQYCGYDCMTDRLQSLSANCTYPTRLHDLGESTQGHSIWALEIGNSGAEVLMAGNIHGDETTGGQLIQRWVWETCNAASREQSDVADNVHVFYLPMFNPDGFEGNYRGNGNRRDLNRDFPTPTQSDNPAGREKETQALVNFVDQHNFVSSMMYHGGAVVVNYPWDNCYTSDMVPRPCPSADVTAASNPAGWTAADVEGLSHVYGDAMTDSCMTSDCTVNGAAWYQITGSLQDYQLRHKGTLDLTLEVSGVKRPAAGQLPNFYSSNYDAMYGFMKASAELEKQRK